VELYTINAGHDATPSADATSQTLHAVAHKPAPFTQAPQMQTNIEPL
jgi:hypothetical protein